MKKIFSISLYLIVATLVVIYGCTNFLSPNSGTSSTGTSGGSGTNGTAEQLKLLVQLLTAQ